MMKKLEKKHTILCTSRNYREVIELAKIRKQKFVNVGKHGGATKAGKLEASIQRMSLLFKKIEKFAPDVTISLCSPDASRISFGLGIPHIGFSNAPHSEAVMRLSVPLLHKLLIPSHIKKKDFTKYGINSKNVIHYNGMDEYLIVKNKSASSRLLFTKKPHEKIILFRTYEAQASYVKKSVNTISMITNLLKKMPNCKLVILGRYVDEINQLQKSLGNQVIVLDKVVDSGQILSSCDVFIGSGGTMTSEAALRGIPTISYNAIPNDDEKYLVKQGIVKRAKNNSEIIKLTKSLLSSDKEKFEKKAQKFLDSMENPYLKLVETIRILKNTRVR